MADVSKLLQLIAAARAQQPLPAAIAPWVVELAIASIPTTQREHARNNLLRRAAALVIGSPWPKVRRLRTEILQARHLWSLYVRRPPEPGSVTALVWEALTIDPDTPASESQLLRILENSDAITVTDGLR